MLTGKQGLHIGGWWVAVGKGVDRVTWWGWCGPAPGLCTRWVLGLTAQMSCLEPALHCTACPRPAQILVGQPLPWPRRQPDTSLCLLLRASWTGQCGDGRSWPLARSGTALAPAGWAEALVKAASIPSSPPPSRRSSPEGSPVNRLHAHLSQGQRPGVRPRAWDSGHPGPQWGQRLAASWGQLGGGRAGETPPFLKRTQGHGPLLGCPGCPLRPDVPLP